MCHLEGPALSPALVLELTWAAYLKPPRLRFGFYISPLGKMRGSDIVPDI